MCRVCGARDAEPRACHASTAPPPCDCTAAWAVCPSFATASAQPPRRSACSSASAALTPSTRTTSGGRGLVRSVTRLTRLAAIIERPDGLPSISVYRCHLLRRAGDHAPRSAHVVRQLLCVERREGERLVARGPRGRRACGRRADRCVSRGGGTSGWRRSFRRRQSVSRRLHTVSGAPGGGFAESGFGLSRRYGTRARVGTPRAVPPGMHHRLAHDNAPGGVSHTSATALRSHAARRNTDRRTGSDYTATRAAGRRAFRRASRRRRSRPCRRQHRTRPVPLARGLAHYECVTVREHLEDRTHPCTRRQAPTSDPPLASMGSPLAGGRSQLRPHPHAGAPAMLCPEPMSPDHRRGVAGESDG